MTPDESSPRLAAVPDPAEIPQGRPERPAEGSAVPTAPPEEEEQVSKKLFLVVLAAFLLAAIAYGVQTQRIGGFEAQVSSLEHAVAGLTGELANANERVLGFEAQREQIRGSVQRVLEDVQALGALVASDPASGALKAPESTPLVLPPDPEAVSELP